MNIYKISKEQILVRIETEAGIKSRQFNLADIQSYPNDIPTTITFLEAETIANPEDLSIIIETPVIMVKEEAFLDGDELSAPATAIEYFKAHPTAISFIRLTPAEQETQIEAMTLTQLKQVVKYLTIAVSALIKREHLT